MWLVVFYLEAFENICVQCFMAPILLLQFHLVSSNPSVSYDFCNFRAHEFPFFDFGLSNPRKFLFK
jgi:hypothetical protein